VKRNWSFEPIDSVMVGRLGVPIVTGDVDPDAAGATAENVARYLGLSGRQAVYRFRRAGMTEPDAERCALALGVHPVNLWPDWFDGVGWDPEQLDLLSA